MKCVHKLMMNIPANGGVWTDIDFLLPDTQVGELRVNAREVLYRQTQSANTCTETR